MQAAKSKIWRRRAPWTLAGAGAGARKKSSGAPRRRRAAGPSRHKGAAAAAPAAPPGAVREARAGDDDAQVHIMTVPFRGKPPADSDDPHARVPGGGSEEATSLIIKAGALSVKGDDEGARRYYREVLGQFPNHYVANCNLGSNLRDEGRPRDAFKYIKRAIRVWPENPIGHACMGGILLDLKKYERALGVLDLALDLQPGYEPALNDRKKALRALGRRGRR